MTLSTLDPRVALVAVDLQRGLATAPVAPHPVADVVARTATLAAAFRARGLPVVLVRVSHAPDGADWAPGRTDSGRRGGGERPEGWDRIVDELAGHPEDVVVTKRNIGAFFGTDLDLQLRRRGVTQIVLTGIATTMGVESTARAAHDHGYHVAVVTDAVSDTDETAHDHSVARVFPRIAETTTTDELGAALAQTRAEPAGAGASPS